MKFFDRVKETSTTTGTSDFTLAGAASGFRTFASVLSVNDTCYYSIALQGGSEWEVGLGTYSNTNTLERTTVLSSSNSDSAVNFSAGTKDVFLTVAAERFNALSPADLLSTLLYSEVSITEAATAAIGKMHVCSGTSADYTVTLPAASGNTGKLIGFRMSSSLTKLVTIDANSTELIDGAATRIMWANESAILLCDGTGWAKIGGKTIPMKAGIYPASAQNITSDSDWSPTTLLNFDTAMSDMAASVASMLDLSNKRMLVPRSSLWTIDFLGRTSGQNTSAHLMLLELYYGSSSAQYWTNIVASKYNGVHAVIERYIAAGGQVAAYCAYSGGSYSSSVFTYNAAHATCMTLVEKPVW